VGRPSSLESLVRRQILLAGVVPVVALSLASIAVVVRHALMESRESARMNAARAAVAIDQATRIMEDHWRGTFAAAAHTTNRAATLRAMVDADSGACLVSIWKGDSLLFSHPRRDESSILPDSGKHWTGAESDPRCDEPVVRHTLHLDSGKLAVVSLRLSRVSKAILDPLHEIDDHLSLIDANGIYVANFKSEILGQKEVDPLSGRMGGMDSVQSGYLIENRIPIGFSAHRLQGPPWTLVARKNTLEIARSLLPLLGLMATFLVLSIAIGARFRKHAALRILAPLAQLKNSVDAVENGRFENPLPLSGMTEIDNLSGAFNRMALAIETRDSRRMKELERAMAGLESFSYTVSHDLRAPLRAIDGHSRILLEDESERLTDAGRQSLERIITATGRMHQLIEDLLRLARTNRSPLTNRMVDMDAMVREFVKESYLDGDKPSKVEWKISELGTAHCDPGLIRQVWSNLVSNAVKYSSRKEAPVVAISRTEEDDWIRWSVKDNGVGFDPDHADKLFGTFQRLHTDAEFEGTGIGLALVRNIVELHGGKVSGTATPGNGATFEFRLPRKCPPT
jgi:signal transduction histidine kinase